MAGGGSALLNAAKGVASSLKPENEEQAVGIRIVCRAAEEPLRQIAANAGLEGSVVVNAVNSSKDINYGFNARDNRYEDMVKAGIVDPTKVVRTALQMASSIAGLMLTTESVVADAPKKEDKCCGHGGGAPDMGGMGGMGGMM